MSRLRPLRFALLIGLVAASPALAAAKRKPAPKPVEPTAPPACEDFFAHANFDWLQAHPLPAGASSFSRWDELNALADQQSRELLTRATPTHPGAASALLADLSASASNQAGLDAGVRATAQPLLAQVDSLKKARDLPRVIAALHAAGVPVLFSLEALRDADSGRPRAWLLPGGLGLPEPGYYLSPAPELQQAVDHYRRHEAALLGFAGLDPASAQAQADLAFGLELALARAMAGNASEDGTPAGLAKRLPAFRLGDYLAAQGVLPTSLSLQQPAWFAAVDAMLAKPNLPQWQAYLRVQVLQALAPAMASDPRANWRAALALDAQGGLQTVAERMQAITRGEAAELLSAAYAENFLDDGRVRVAESTGEAVRAAMGRAIDRAAWLSADGKAASRSKLAAMRLAIAKPADAADFTTLRLDRNNYAANLLALRLWNRARALARLASATWPWPVSQGTPAIGYQPAQNQLIVTAAALQAPALDPATPARSFGSLGALLAQQMSLGVAEYGGNDGRELAMRQLPLVTQYDAFPAGNSPVNGTRMLRQNAADLSAIEIAFDAFEAAGPQDSAARQEFFRAWGVVWARQDDPAALAAAQNTSAFAPARWRVNGPLANHPAFASAFACKDGARMVRAAGQQVAIWR